MFTNYNHCTCNVVPPMFLSLIALNSCTATISTFFLGYIICVITHIQLYLLGIGFC